MSLTYRYLLNVLLIGFVFIATGCNSNDDQKKETTEPLTILVLGDSISTGEEVPGVPPWPSLLQESQPGWTVINSSRGGNTSAAGAAKVSSEVARYNPTHVVIYYGANDAIQNVEGAYEGNVRAMVAVSRSAGAIPVIVRTSDMYQARAVHNNKLNIVLNAARRVASETGSRIADVNGETRNEPGLFPDGLHPGLDGQRIIMLTIREQL